KEQLIVALWLYRQSRICGSPTVTVPTKGLQHLGIGRWAKYKLLPALQQAGVLTIERRSGRAIKVTLTHWPDAPECRTRLDRGGAIADWAAGPNLIAPRGHTRLTLLYSLFLCLLSQNKNDELATKLRGGYHVVHAQFRTRRGAVVLDPSASTARRG